MSINPPCHHSDVNSLNPSLRICLRPCTWELLPSPQPGLGHSSRPSVSMTHIHVPPRKGFNVAAVFPLTVVISTWLTSTAASDSSWPKLMKQHMCAANRSLVGADSTWSVASSRCTGVRWILHLGSLVFH